MCFLRKEISMDEMRELAHFGCYGWLSNVREGTADSKINPTAKE
jgi:hypothetical protein